MNLFISHTTRDDTVVLQLRHLLEDRGFEVHEDASSFDVNEPLPSQIRTLLDEARALIVVVSPAAAGSPWVVREVAYFTERRRSDPELGIVPLMLESAEVGHLRALFGTEAEVGPATTLVDYPDEPFALMVPGTPARLRNALPRLLARLAGERFSGSTIPRAHRSGPISDLVVQVHGDDANGSCRASLSLIEDGVTEPITSESFSLELPLDEDAAVDLRFYLERYVLAPFDEAHERKVELDRGFARWGKRLFAAIDPDSPSHRPLVERWLVSEAAERRLTLEAPLAPRDLEAIPSADAAIAQRVLGLPWELAHDGGAYLFLRGGGVRVRRALPWAGAIARDLELVQPPLRVLVVVPRPEVDGVAYVDHRHTSRPLVRTLSRLGDLVEWSFLTPPTLPTLERAVRDARHAGRPFHVVHFDGHGRFGRTEDHGELVFEAPGDRAPTNRGAHLVDADLLGELLAEQGVELLLLGACESADAEHPPSATVAGRLLHAGMPAVVAMSHRVLVQTMQRFTDAFYEALVDGQRVGSAMLAAQVALHRDPTRGTRWRPADQGAPLQRDVLNLQDWFVPVLYQHRDDRPILDAAVPMEDVADELATQLEVRLGRLATEAPAHPVVGRSREMLLAERLLVELERRWLLIIGQSGEGKTTLAVEMARWWVESERLARAAFMSVEVVPDVRSVVWAWGEQLRPGRFAEGAGSSLDSALDYLIACLRDRPAVLVLDNLESILPAAEGSFASTVRIFDAALYADLFRTLGRIVAECEQSRLLITSREVPAVETGFADPDLVLRLGALGPGDAKRLVAHVLGTHLGVPAEDGLEPVFAAKQGEIDQLVGQVHGHARSLVLLAPELARRSIEATTAALADVLGRLHREQGPDREASLLASVELGLRRLPPEVRSRLAPLGVFEGGAHASPLSMVLGLDITREEEVPFVVGLVNVGLARLHGEVLIFDPALAPAMLAELR
ncbi:MAG: CHAT domain-containing protein, partial [Myxococcota bacterium]